MPNPFEMFIDNDIEKQKYDLLMLNNTIRMFNASVAKYTNSFQGSISKPKEELKDIPNQYSNISDYINSKQTWKTILKFIKESNIIDLYDYINVMVRNWNDIKLKLHLNINRPCYKIIFSLKMLDMYYNYKTKENNVKAINDKIVTNTSDNFYDLNPNFENNNKQSLIRLKNLNQDLDYKEIVQIFKGEFTADFVDKINSLNYNQLSEYLKEN